MPDSLGLLSLQNYRMVGDMGSGLVVPAW